MSEIIRDYCCRATFPKPKAGCLESRPRTFLAAGNLDDPGTHADDLEASAHRVVVAREASVVSVGLFWQHLNLFNTLVQEIERHGVIDHSVSSHLDIEAGVQLIPI